MCVIYKEGQGKDKKKRVEYKEKRWKGKKASAIKKERSKFGCERTETGGALASPSLFLVFYPNPPLHSQPLQSPSTP